SLMRRCGWKMPCTHSCKSEKIVLLTKEKTNAARARIDQCGACAASHKHPTAAATAPAAIAALSRAGIAGLCRARASRAASSSIARSVVNDAALGRAVPARERPDHAAGRQQRAGRELGAGTESRARAHHGATADTRGGDVDPVRAIRRQAAG